MGLRTDTLRQTSDAVGESLAPSLTQRDATAQPRARLAILAEVRARAGRELAHTYAAWLPRFRAANLVSRIIPTTALNTVRAAIYRAAGFQVGARVAFLSGITIIGNGPEVYRNLRLGEGCLISVNPTFNLDDTITLGQNVSLGPNVTIYTSTHLLGPASRRMHPEVMKRPVVIEDGVWIGVNSLILPGVTIGRGSVISAGAVVSEDVPPNSLVAGNPARVLQELPTLE